MNPDAVLSNFELLRALKNRLDFRFYDFVNFFWKPEVKITAIYS